VEWTQGATLEYPVCSCWSLRRRATVALYDGVRSPVDNVPNWVQMVTGESLGESSSVKG